MAVVVAVVVSVLVRDVVRVDVREVVPVVVSVLVRDVVGVVRSQLANVPSMKEASAAPSTLATVSQLALTFSASPMVHDTACSTSPREYSLTILDSPAADFAQSFVSTRTAAPLIVGPHAMVSRPWQTLAIALNTLVSAAHTWLGLIER